MDAPWWLLVLVVALASLLGAAIGWARWRGLHERRSGSEAVDAGNEAPGQARPAEARQGRSRERWLRAVEVPSEVDVERGEGTPTRGAPPERAPDARGGEVVEMPRARLAPRRWNLWELERLARADAQRHPERAEERAYLFVHLRQFANPDGALPPEFDALVRESFGDLLEPSRRA